MPRNAAEKKYHREKQKTYRDRKRMERDRALGNFIGSASVLRERHGYTIGQLVDLLTEEIS